MGSHQETKTSLVFRDLQLFFWQYQTAEKSSWNVVQMVSIRRVNTVISADSWITTQVVRVAADLSMMLLLNEKSLV